MEEFLKALLPRMIDPAIIWKIINYQSKDQMLRLLPNRLLGYSNIPAITRPKSLILIDRDSDDCMTLKAKLELFCQNSGISSISNAQPNAAFDVVNRIVIEELEAWFFGDVPALSQAWHGVPHTLAAKAAYRNCDDIKGGTHEALLRVLQKAGHYKRQARLPKIEVARRMGQFLNPDDNASVSYQHFRSGLNALIAQF